jgi:hypothetical protein
MSSRGPETRLTLKCKKSGLSIYRERLVLIKYHGDNMTESGVSDFIGTIDGTFLAIEMKAPNNYKTRGVPDPIKACKRGPTTKQRAFLMRVRAAGGIWAVCASEEQFLETLAAGVDHLGGQEFPPMPWLDLADFPGADGALCTCDTKHGCERKTEFGCTYCRENPHLPCPNTEKE